MILDADIRIDSQERAVRKRDRRSTLTEEDIAQIKAHLLEGKHPAIIARYFEIAPRTIYNIRAEKSYRHVAPAANATPLAELSKAKRRV